jgi:hypothetical protein
MVAARLADTGLNDMQSCRTDVRGLCSHVRDASNRGGYEFLKILVNFGNLTPVKCADGADELGRPGGHVGGNGGNA